MFQVIKRDGIKVSVLADSLAYRFHFYKLMKPYINDIGSLLFTFK